MFFANFIFVVSHLKVHPAVHLKTSKVLTSFKSKRKVYQKFTSFRYSDVLTRVKKDKMIDVCINGANKNSNIRTLVVIIFL